MSAFFRWPRWLASWWSHGAREADLDGELEDWIDELTARYETAGLSSIDARRRALIETGGVQQVKEAVHDARAGAAFDALRVDLRYACRGLLKTRKLTLVIVATLA